MTKVNEKLNFKMIKRLITPKPLSTKELEKFKKDIIKLHVNILDMYLFSIEGGKYEITDYMVEHGFDVNRLHPEWIASRIIDEDIESIKRFIKDGLRINKKLLDRLKKILSDPENYYEEEYLQYLQDIYDNKQLRLKLQRLKKNIKSKV